MCFYYTNNFTTQQIIKCGGNKTHIYSIALKIFNLTCDHKIRSEAFWVGRDYNKEANKISKTVDFDNWRTTQQLINILEKLWEKILIDIFDSDINRKSKRFNSQYLCPETDSINTFSISYQRLSYIL